MADQSQLSLLLQGASHWNDWRAGAGQDVKADLSSADLAGKDLSAADLRRANFDSANLRNARLGPGSLLWKADFSGSDLYQADLGGADLQEVNFATANLFEANLREANLQGADLHQVNGGLRTEQLAGANLTGAKLPDHLTKLYDALENVKSISESARKLFLAVLAACLYSWLTIATTTDVNLITNRSSSPLPIIQTSIPIVGFYVVAPLLLLCVYFYLHFYLQKLWEELGSLPAIFPDGRPLHAKVDPWLLNDLVRAHLPKLSVNRPFMSYFQLWISVLLAWWVVPITMLLFWGRYLRRHELIGTGFHVVLLVISIVAAVRLYRLAVFTLSGAKRKPFTWKNALPGPKRFQAAALACVVGILFGLISFAAVHGVRSGAPILGYTPESEKQYGTVSPDEYVIYGPRTWVPRCMALFGSPPFASLENAELSQKKSTWSGKKKYDPDSVIGAQLKGADLRYASAKKAFLAGADLGGTDLSGAHLRRANLNGADLSYADLTGTDLINANLRDVALNGSDLTGAKVWIAALAGADLSGADLQNTILTEADVLYANFRGARNLKEVPDAKNREKAFYDDDMLKVLGLPPDHNEKLAQEYAKKHPKENIPHWIQFYLPRQ